MDKKVIFLSRSDLRGGAAIVTYRLMSAMRELGVDARMLVCEKLSDSPYVDYCAPKWKIRYSFLKERLNVFFHNGLKYSTLFRIDPASDGLPVYDHPWALEADAFFLGWVNQGMISLDGVAGLSLFDVPVVWIMHDMWNMTGVCHHAGKCKRYQGHCGECPLLWRLATPRDMSYTTWEEKKDLYDICSIRFVAVSSWLARKAEESSLLKGREVAVIPNPFPIADATSTYKKKNSGDRVRIIFGAARIDDPIKGLPVLKKALQVFRDNHPEESANIELVIFGSVKHAKSLEGFVIPTRHLGVLSGEDAIRKAYEDCDIVVSSSDFETLPGTLVEGQAYGCIPVAFDHGGQRDIITHEKTGYLIPWNDDPMVRSTLLAEGLLWAYKNANDSAILQRMRQSVARNFSATAVAERLLDFAFK